MQQELKKHPTIERAAIRCELTVVWNELECLLHRGAVIVSNRSGVWRGIPLPADRNVERHPSPTAENALKAARGFRLRQGDARAMAFTVEDVRRAKDMVRNALAMFSPETLPS